MYLVLNAYPHRVLGWSSLPEIQPLWVHRRRGKTSWFPGLISDPSRNVESNLTHRSYRPRDRVKIERLGQRSTLPATDPRRSAWITPLSNCRRHYHHPCQFLSAQHPAQPHALSPSSRHLNHLATDRGTDSQVPVDNRPQ